MIYSLSVEAVADVLQDWSRCWAHLCEKMLHICMMVVYVVVRRVICPGLIFIFWLIIVNV